jgi:hypothetical protein
MRGDVAAAELASWQKIAAPAAYSARPASCHHRSKTRRSRSTAMNLPRDRETSGSDPRGETGPKDDGCRRLFDEAGGVAESRHTQPRRIAARAVGARIAEELKTTLAS